MIYTNKEDRGGSLYLIRYRGVTIRRGGYE